jgi:hypothetical protein
MAVLIQPPLEIFTDLNGDPLEAGYIYIGTENLEPETNPINVYYDEALLYPAPQPIRTVAGAPSRDGKQALLYIADSNVRYSTKVKDKNGNLITSSPTSTTVAVAAIEAQQSASASQTAAEAAQTAAEAAQAAAEAAVASDSLIQVVNASYGAPQSATTQVPLDGTIPSSSEGDEVMSLNITPTSASNNLRIDVVVNVSANAATTMTVGILRDGDPAWRTSVPQILPASYEMYNVSFSYFTNAVSTATVAWKVRMGPSSAGSVVLNGNPSPLYAGTVASSITISEIKP